MSPNWRKKEAMSAQTLIAATADLHLKQAEEITRPQLRPYPPRIPEDAKPTNQAENQQRSPSAKIRGEDIEIKVTTEHQSAEDNSYHSRFQHKLITSADTPSPDLEYDVLPEPNGIAPESQRTPGTPKLNKEERNAEAKNIQIHTPIRSDPPNGDSHTGRNSPARQNTDEYEIKGVQRDNTSAIDVEYIRSEDKDEIASSVAMPCFDLALKMTFVKDNAGLLQFAKLAAAI
ncbi:hypothetical protein DFP73DRAFT_599022 [Morchella snyderi]|nr:hypothetical protein DFP73DRAFT_599022 [Morchella snyderi]